MASWAALIVTRAAEYMLLGLSFGLIYSVVRFFHFAHGATIAFGAYAGYVVGVQAGAQPLIGALSASALGAALGVCLEVVVYQPFRKREATATTLLLVSLGAYTVLQNLLSIVFGDATRSLRRGSAPMLAGLATLVTVPQAALIITSIVVGLMLLLWMRVSEAGMRFRATAADPDLFRTLGGSPRAVILAAMALGSALAGLTGWLVAWDIGMTPDMGFNALLVAVVVALVGGPSSIGGIAAAAVGLASLEVLAVALLPAKWMTSVAFLVLLLAMLFRRGALATQQPASVRP